ncbi:2TM domain-containing protein [Microbulbifer sp. ZKSA006]|uniref:2TM domain-containing protein n=1 Tax=Microbulbifer sp. ZKSA006 TaxID=3243390 RepID=UPI004039F77D
MNSQDQTSDKERAVIEHVKKLKSFYQHLITYLLVISGLVIVNLIFSPEYLWSLWAAFGWGIGLASHAIGTFNLFNFFGEDWEKKQVEKRMGKK